MLLSTVLLCGLVILKVVKELSLIFYDISIVNDESGERYVVYPNEDLRYWSIANYVALHSLFVKYIHKYGLCHLEIRPRLNETY